MIIAFDPSIVCTGYCIMQAGGDVVVEAGALRPPSAGRARSSGHSGGGGPRERIDALVRDAVELVECIDEPPDAIVVEWPQPQIRGARGRRSAASLPLYGVAVGALTYALEAMLDRTAGQVISVDPHTWTTQILPPELRATGDDPKKTRRVAYVSRLYGFKGDAPLGAETDAGNVADAILIARWWAVSKGQNVEMSTGQNTEGHGAHGGST